MKKRLNLIFILALLAVLAFPLTASAQSGGPYTAGFQLQNLEASTANITINYYDQAGATIASVGDTLGASASKTYFPLTAVSSGFNGSVVVSSDKQLAAITNVLTSDFLGGASYSGFTSGANTVNLPLVMKNNFNISTWYNVQNTGGAAANVSIAYSGTSCTDAASIPANAAKTFDQATNTCLPSGYVGAGTITSNQPVVATVMQIITGQKALLAYNGFTSSSTNPVMPLVSSNFFSSGTGIQIQNTGGSATDVTLSYSPSAGFPGAACTETRNIAAGASTTFSFPQLPLACGTQGSGVTDATNGGFVGSARVSANSANMPLVAIVNQITRGRASQAAYNAVNPATATSNVSLPLVMDRNFNIFTGFAVANVGTQTTNIACTFTASQGTAPPNIASTAVASGASLTAVQLNQAGTVPFVGSANCLATGGDAKIAAIVNELTNGAPATNDALLVYEGFNY